MGGLFSQPKAPTIVPPQLPKPKAPPKPEPPIAQGQPGEAVTDIKSKHIKAGRAGTILTGQLAPRKVGKKRLLG